MNGNDMNGSQGRATVLVIDDEVSMREGCRRVLASSGFVVETAGDIAASLELIAAQDYDVYLIDVMLPDGSGLDLMGTILQQNATAVCIVITGFARIETAVEAIRQGAYDFLSKPFVSDELLISVAQGLEWRRLRAIERDAQKLATAKDQLEQLDKIKSQSMLTVAHELRAPVAAALSYVNLILSGYVSESEMKATLTRIQERLQAMLDMIADILELARLRQAKLAEGQELLGPELVPQDMASILEEVVELLKEQAAQKQQSLETTILDRPVLHGDREQLKRIWMNLISNAIKYTPEGGHIAVKLQADRDKAIGVVEDSGIGIAEEDVPNVFRDFFRTDEAKASGEIGTGLGLAIVKQIVDRHQGQVEVASVLGQGSRFTFTLPLGPPPKDDPPEGDVAPHTLSGGTPPHTPTGPVDQVQSFILGGDTGTLPRT